MTDNSYISWPARCTTALAFARAAPGPDPHDHGSLEEPGAPRSRGFRKPERGAVRIHRGVLVRAKSKPAHADQPDQGGAADGCDIEARFAARRVLLFQARDTI